MIEQALNILIVEDNAALAANIYWSAAPAASWGCRRSGARCWKC
jgi:hypothetical protein